MATVAPSPSTIIPHGSQRNAGIESKNAHCTYQVLTASPLAFSGETHGEQPFLVFSQATQQLTPLQKEHSPREMHTFCVALSSQGPQAPQGALADLSGSETQRNPGLSDSVLLERKRKQSHKRDGSVAAAAITIPPAPGSPGSAHWRWVSPSLPFCCLFGFLSPSLSSFLRSCSQYGEERTCLCYFHCKEQGG